MKSSLHPALRPTDSTPFPLSLSSQIADISDSQRLESKAHNMRDLHALVLFPIISGILSEYSTKTDISYFSRSLKVD